MFADADALGAWQHDEPIDGLADFVIWGADAAKVAARCRLPALPDEQWGFLNRPVREMARRAETVERMKGRYGWRFACDFRPHSHHWQAMSQVRVSATDSGTVEVGGARMCVWMTSWGDGLFPVYLDRDSAGQLLRVRVEVGNPDTITRQERMEEMWFGEFAREAVVSRLVWEAGQPVGYLVREEPVHENDSGWLVLAGTETADYLETEGNTELVPLRELIGRDRTLEGPFRSPVGSAFRRASPEAPFAPVVR
jgi:hypothetical protein